MKSRIVLIFVLFVVLWGALLAKGFYLQVLPDERLSHLQKKQFEKVVTLKPRRGAIIDRNEKELAVSVASYSLFADPKLIRHPRATARQLSKVIGLSFSKIYKKLISKERRFVWIQRQLSREVKDKISRLNIEGLGFIDEPKRIYPNQTVFSQTLGFVGTDGDGLEGLELQYDSLLGGRQKTVQLRKDARGRPLLINGQIFTEYPDGSNLQLTIDSSIQYYLEKELEHAMDLHDADSGVGLVVDVESGEILAMANHPVFNSNRPRLYSSDLRRNRIVTDPFEPGSTMKTFVVATALREKIVQPNTKIFCENGKYQVADRTIKEADDHHQFGWLSVSEILAHSSNIGTAKIALKIGDKKLRQHLVNFGFGASSGIELPGESRGVLHKLPWNDHLLSNIAFGHGLSVTPLQVAMAYAAIANGGFLYKPIIVRSVFNDVTGETQNFKSEVVRRVLSDEDAATLRFMLMSATAEAATGAKARIPGFPVAGKTGTAQKVDMKKGGYLPKSYISSFAGFVPANQPKYVIYVAIDNPRDQYYGSQVAAPVFAKIASYLVRKDGIEPVLISQKNLIKTDKVRAPLMSVNDGGMIKGELTKTPDLRGLSLREVYTRLRGTGLQVKVQGSGLVSSSSPLPGENLPKSGRIQLQLE